MSTFAIGDVQGCFQSLQQLLKKINYKADRDILWFCGDVINRGPDSLRCLQVIKDLVEAEQALMVLGNHDLHFLAVAAGVKALSNYDTLNDILESSRKNAYIDFLRQQALTHYDPNLNFFLVHAGLIPQWNKDDALRYGKEVEAALQNDATYKKFLETMYGNEPKLWQEDLQGYDRLRFITNVLTRIRFCSENGEMNLVDKRTLGSQRDQTMPWFQVSNRQSEKDKLIFGHWAALYPNWGEVKSDYLFPIDSGCVWGNALTALKLDTKEYVNVKSELQKNQ